LPKQYRFGNAPICETPYVVANEGESIPGYSATTRFLVTPWNKEAEVNAEYVLFRKDRSGRSAIYRVVLVSDDIRLVNPHLPVGENRSPSELLSSDDGSILGAIFDVFSDLSFWHSRQ